MKLKQLVKKQLEDGGFDGLVHPELECGCGNDDLFPCGMACPDDCETAFLHRDELFYTYAEDVDH